MKRTAKLAGLTLPLALGCGPSQTLATRPRDYQAGAYGAHSAHPVISGHASWQESEACWLVDLRASHVGEPVLIRIDESPERALTSNTTLNAPRWSGFAQALQRSHPELRLADLLTLLRATSSGGRSETELDVHIKKALPNGALFVEGTRVAKTASDELHIYVSGVVQREDLAHETACARAQ